MFFRMLPELIYREERLDDFRVLFLLGALTVLIGFAAASYLFPARQDLVTVVFASIPLVYPMTAFFLETEGDFTEDIEVYAALFAGQVTGYFLVALMVPGALEFQLQALNVRGFATVSAGFSTVVLNNIGVFVSILAVSAIIGSSGAFILGWNASAVGAFFAVLVSRFATASSFFTCSPNPSPLCYFPHTVFEMTGFIIAGVAGTLLSAAIYRREVSREHQLRLLKLVSAGLLLVLLGAIIEAA